jgi:hypothetical protein
MVLSARAFRRRGLFSCWLFRAVCSDNRDARRTSIDFRDDARLCLDASIAHQVNRMDCLTLAFEDIRSSIWSPTQVSHWSPSRQSRAEAATSIDGEMTPVRYSCTDSTRSMIEFRRTKVQMPLRFTRSTRVDLRRPGNWHVKCISNVRRIPSKIDQVQGARWNPRMWTTISQSSRQHEPLVTG